MKLKHLIILALTLTTMASCRTSKTSLPYFQDIAGVEEGVISRDIDTSIKIAPGDELAITVTSRNPIATAGYNMPLTNPATMNDLGTASTPRIQTYVVDNNGDITMPILGSIHVAGMTTKELQQYITRRIEPDVDSPTVLVEFVQYYINVIGEVSRPGRYRITTQRYSILDALANAGDLTQYGERANVLLIREEDNVRKFHRFNLNEASTLDSPYFYLQQNDVLYVSPNQTRQENSKYNQNNAFKVQVVSAIVSGVSVVASLVIALAVK